MILKESPREETRLETERSLRDLPTQLRAFTGTDVGKTVSRSHQNDSWQRFAAT